VKDFTCPECGVTYALHWWATDGSLLCRTCADTRAGRCRWPGHPDHDNPCAYAQEEPGGPCRYCARPVPADGTPCPVCWVSLEGMALADTKALFAADGTFDIAPRVRP
jgi:hypothetical protein